MASGLDNSAQQILEIVESEEAEARSAESSETAFKPLNHLVSLLSFFRGEIKRRHLRVFFGWQAMSIMHEVLKEDYRSRNEPIEGATRKEVLKIVKEYHRARMIQEACRLWKRNEFHSSLLYKFPDMTSKPLDLAFKSMVQRRRSSVMAPRGGYRLNESPDLWARIRGWFRRENVRMDDVSMAVLEERDDQEETLMYWQDFLESETFNTRRGRRGAILPMDAEITL